MIKLRTVFPLIIISLLTSCEQEKKQETSAYQDNNIELKEKKDSKIEILNFGTFHFGFTPDATTIEFDENDKKNQKEIHEIAQKLSEFKPTVILVETVPEFDNELKKEYESYLINQSMTFKNPTEIELLAYEVGRLSGTKRIYGIDHKMGYNYRIGHEIKNSVDTLWYNRFYKNPYKFYPKIDFNGDSLNLLDKLKLKNHKRYLDFSKAINADMLTHAGTEKGFEGADEATKFYQRNLRMYTNLNRIQLNKNDRVFILMGSAHTAFFRDFFSRSPKYKMVNTFDYLE